MEDILIPGAKLKAFKVCPDEVKQILQTVEKRQVAILKMKVVNEEELRKVINI